MLLKHGFYYNDDVVDLARTLLGKEIFTRIDGYYTSGIVSETEAYAGVIDKASHAYGNRRTNRTEIMYGEGGTAYVYLCYGVHHLFNVVSNRAGVPHAILLRGIVPMEGISIMENRRGRKMSTKGFADGPGKVSKTLGIDLTLNGKQINGEQIGIIDRGFEIPDKRIYSGPRIGVNYAGKDARLPYRFLINDLAWIKKNLLTP